MALLWLALAGEVHAQVAFSSATHFNAGAQPVGIVTRDFSGDGRLDLAVGNGFITPGTVSILQGTASGSFGAATTLTMPGTSAYAVAAGDFNRDGVADVAVTVTGAGKVAILLGTGAGAFGAATTFNVGFSPVSIAIGDFDRDGKPDLAVANQVSNTVSVLLGNGNGTFGAAVNHAVGNSPSSVVVADFDRDGKADIATADGFSASVSILLGDGAGGFAPASNVFVGIRPVSLVPADLDKDGNVDLVVAHETSVSSGTVSVLLGNGNGLFGFPSGVTISGAGLSDVAVADLDGDGNADVVAAVKSGSVAVLLGNGSGGLGTPASFAVGSDPRGIAIADFNGDAKADVAVTNRGSDTVSILLNTTAFVVSARTWGSNDEGALGNGTTGSNSATPVAVSNLHSIAAVSAGFQHMLALKGDGTVWAWGANWGGPLGDGTSNHSAVPVQVLERSTTSIGTPIGGVIAISAGDDSSLALRSDGTVWGWGNDLHGQTGTGDFHGTHVAWPVLGGLEDVVAISSGMAYSMALKADGAVWSWGWNTFGQLGDGTLNIERHTPVPVSGLTNVIAIVASGSGWHSLALESDGTVWAWGRNDRGQLGDGTTSDRLTPVQVSGLSGVRALAAGSFHSVALKADGTVWAWGDNGHGQLGDGTTVQRNTPVQVPSFGGVVAVSAGQTHTVVLKADGTAWSWGGNGLSGQLGDGTFNFFDRTIPGQVAGITAATALSTGGQHSIVILKGMTIAAMITIVQGMNLAPGVSNGLMGTLGAAQNAYDAGNLRAACSQVRAFGHQVRAFSGRQVSVPDAQRLLGAQGRVETSLGCS